MNSLYLDLFSGISGDMFIGALLDLGVDAGALDRELAKLGLRGFHVHVSRQQRGAIEGVKFDVHTQDHGEDHGHGKEHEHEHEHQHEHEQGHGHEHGHEQGQGQGRTFAAIRSMIVASALSDWVKARAVAVFERVAVAEGKIHGQPPEHVHFHEVGAVDSIVDIVGACVGLDLLGRPRVMAGPVIEGMGTVRCAHGEFPLPAPATLEILKARNVVVRQCEEPHELITPTGAALLAEFAESFGPMPPLAVRRIGYGLGTRHHKSRPNVLRAVLGTGSESGGRDWETDTVTVLETNLDDINAELLGRFVDRAFAAGALDVFHTAIQMKKNRPGVLLSVLCRDGDADRMTELMLVETSAFGVRRHACERRKLRRESIQVETEFGVLSVKLGRLDGRVVQASPEFESCREASERSGATLKRVYEAALRAVTT